jgi:hypothetical protein
MDPARGAFICEICHAELVDNENMESVKGSQDRMQRFNKQMLPITKGLQKSESMVIPALSDRAATYPFFSPFLTDLTSRCGSRITQLTGTGKNPPRLAQGSKSPGPVLG